MSREQDYFSVSFLRTSDKLSHYSVPERDREREERHAGGKKFVVRSLEGRASLRSDRQLANKHRSGTSTTGRTWILSVG